MSENQTTLRRELLKRQEPMTACEGLLYIDGEMIPLPQADEEARKLGFPHAEALVRDLEAQGKVGKHVKPKKAKERYPRGWTPDDEKAG